ncbi:phosphonate transporter [Sphingomonas oligophenolica]|uniref:phosphonate transporter n=1 Tax=Sphingomonas oligophenolica TaxID=301154 RepID=UPI001F4FCB1C|nr:phosphonate transporter [Sphingomonas oligophenolica]
MVTIAQLSFDTIDLAELEAMAEGERDGLPFGVVGVDHQGTTQVYNRTEAAMAGLDRESVLGSGFFETVAQCMNNFMVAQRFEDEPTLDEIIPYVLTLRMRPTRVRLRLLARAGAPLRFILIER